MMMGLNTTQIAMPPMPRCNICTSSSLTLDGGCTCHPKPRSGPIFVSRFDYVLLYDGGDAVGIECVECETPNLQCDELTPAHGRYRAFIENGNVYALMTDVRVGQQLEIRVIVNLDPTSPVQEVWATANVIIR